MCAPRLYAPRHGYPEGSQCYQCFALHRTSGLTLTPFDRLKRNGANSSYHMLSFFWLIWTFTDLISYVPSGYKSGRFPYVVDILRLFRQFSQFTHFNHFLLLDLRFHSCMEGPFMHPNGAMGEPSGSGVYNHCTPFVFFLFFSFFCFCFFAVSPPYWVSNQSIQVSPNILTRLWQTWLELHRKSLCKQCNDLHVLPNL